MNNKVKELLIATLEDIERNLNDTTQLSLNYGRIQQCKDIIRIEE